MAGEGTLLTMEFLRWLAARPRQHAEVREAWASTCPLNCAWEDAIAADLVRHLSSGEVSLTERGRARLELAATGPHPPGASAAPRRR